MGAVKSKKPPMTKAQAEAKNPGGGNLIEAAAKKKALHEARISQVCEELGILEEIDKIRTLPVEDRKAFLLQLTFAGLSVADGARVLGIGTTTANRWFRENPEEMQRLVKSTLCSESLKEVGPTWARLSSLRWSGNAETSRKASLDVLSVAGMSPHQPAGISVNLTVKDAQLSITPIDKLEAELKELARQVGPGAEKIVDAELISVKDFHGNAARKAAAAALPGSGAGEDQGTPGGAPPAEIKPAD